MLVKKNLTVKKISFKYSIGSNDDNDVVRPLCIKHHQMVVLSLLNDLIPIRQGLLRLIIIIY